MSYINSIRFRSFSFYNSNNNFKRNFISGRVNNEAVSEISVSRRVIQPIDSSIFWRSPKGKKNYSLKTAH